MYFERHGSATMRIIGPLTGDKLSVSDGQPCPMPVVATLDPQGRRFALTMQALIDAGGVLRYNHTEYVSFDCPGWQTPAYSAVQRYEPWAGLVVQIDPSDSQVKVYSGAWSGDGVETRSLCVHRSGLYYVP